MKNFLDLKQNEKKKQKENKNWNHELALTGGYFKVEYTHTVTHTVDILFCTILLYITSSSSLSVAITIRKSSKPKPYLNYFNRKKIEKSLLNKFNCE